MMFGLTSWLAILDAVLNPMPPNVTERWVKKIKRSQVGRKW